jgi:hypothetical protein
MPMGEAWKSTAPARASHSMTLRMPNRAYVSSADAMRSISPRSLRAKAASSGKGRARATANGGGREPKLPALRAFRARKARCGGAGEMNLPQFRYHPQVSTRTGQIHLAPARMVADISRQVEHRAHAAWSAPSVPEAAVSASRSALPSATVSGVLGSCASAATCSRLRRSTACYASSETRIVS